MINNIDHKDKQIAYLGQLLQHYQDRCSELELQLAQANATIERLISDSVEALVSKRNVWFSHCPIHPQEIRNRVLNIHEHLHNNVVMEQDRDCFNSSYEEIDYSYFNACVEHTNYKPISFAKIMEIRG